MHYTLHMLLHFAQFVEMLGPMYEWSAYKYESRIGEVHNLLNSMNLPLSQMNRRIRERERGFVEYVSKDPIKLTEKRINHQYPEYEGIPIYKSYQMKNF